MKNMNELLEQMKKDLDYKSSYSKNPLDDEWDEDEYWDDDYDYSLNAPCDNSGFCAGPSCSRYFECQH